MVFFNDPLPCDDAAERAVRMAVAMRDAGQRARRALAPRGPRPRLRHRHRPGLRDAGPDRLRGPLRLRRDRQRHQPGRPAVRRRRALADPRHPAGARRRRARRRSARTSASVELHGLQPAGPRLRRQGHSTTRRIDVMTGDLLDAAGRRGRRCCRRSTRTSATAASTSCRRGWPTCGRRCGSTTRTSRSSSSRRSPSTGPSATQRQPDPGLRGALPVPAAAAAPAAAADGLRDLDADRTRRSSSTTSALLPGVIPSHARARLTLVSVGDSLAALAEREAAGAAAAARARSRDLIPNRGALHLVPYNTTDARARPRAAASASRCTAPTRGSPTLGTKTGCRRLFARGRACRTRSGAEDLHTRRRHRRTRSSAMRARAARACSRRSSSSTRASPGPATPWSTCAACRRPATPDERGRGRASACASMELEAETIAVDAYLGQVRGGGGIVEERIAGDGAAQPERADAGRCPTATVELLSTHDQLLGGASGQSYLGCVFPADPGVRRGDHASTPRRSGERLATRGRARPVRRRLRRGAGRRRAPGRRTPSSSTCARAAPPTRSSPCSSSPTAATTPTTGAVPDPARAREAPGRHRPPRVRRCCAALTRRRPVRHRRPARPALRPVPAGRAWCST